MDSLIRDLRCAVRSLVRFKGLTVVAIACMALGIGVCATLFAAVNPWLFRPLPFPEPDRLVGVRGMLPGSGFGGSLLSGPDYLDLQQRASRSIESLGGCDRTELNLSTEDAPVRVQAALVTASLFPTLRIQPIRGRGIAADEDQAGGPRSALIGHSLWQRRFGGAEDAVGRTLRLDGVSHTIVGVMPPGFAFPEYAEVWAPLRLEREEARRSDRNVDTVARLREGASLEQAQAEMRTIAAALEREHPDTNRARGMEARPLLSWFTPPGVVIGLRLLLAAGLFIQLIVCSNVANLLLAKAVAQRREVAIRLALGAGRARLLRHFLLEALVIAVAGSVLGVMAAGWGVKQLISASPVRQPYWVNNHLDLTGLAVVVAVTVFSALAVAAMPALQADGSRAFADIKEGSHTLAGGRHGRIGRLLVVSELGLALVLLICAALMVQSFRNRQNMDAGLDLRPALTARLALSGEAYADGTRRAELLEELVRRVRALPGVELAGVGSFLPFNDPLAGGWAQRRFEVDGHPVVDEEKLPRAVYVSATTTYLEATGVRLRQGRLFDAAEEREGRPVVVVSEDVAHAYWGGADPIGRQLRLANGPWLRVVGVVQQTRESGDMILVGEKPPTQIYVPYRLDPRRTVSILVRTSAEPSAFADPLRATLRALEPGLPLGAVYSLEESRSRANWVSLLWGSMMAQVAALALLLAALGVYGVVSHMVSQRTHEIGLRMAVGAGRRDVVRLVVRHGLRLALQSAVAGLLAALVCSRALSSLLYGVSASDPLIFGGCALVLTLAAIVASSAPALRAARLDPLAALRNE